jgi:uncharacterized protein (TIGR00725 family)
MSKILQIAVIGSAGQEEYPQNIMNFVNMEALAFETGKLLAQNNCIVVNGGKSGIMEASAKGAIEAGGLTVGVIKGNKRGESNQFIKVEIVTNALYGGDAFLIPRMCDGAIMIGGGAGTLAEVAGFYSEGKPVVAISNSGGWASVIAGSYLDDRKTVFIDSASSASEAVVVLFRRLNYKVGV